MEHPASPLFAGWNMNLIRACLQGHMGTVSSDGNLPPRSALCTIGDFCFLAGAPNPALAAQVSRPILISGSEDWAPVVQAVFGEKATSFTRYAMEEPDAFDCSRLAAYASSLPAGVTLSPILPEHYSALMGQSWSRDLCGNFRDEADFSRRGLGVAAWLDGLPVAGASSYAVCSDGIEIEIDTRPDQRRRGLALACGARLILDCLARGLSPGWDAHTPASAALAEKLGYRLGRPYRAYWLKELAQSPAE